MATKPLTLRQEQALRIVRWYDRVHGRFPTQGELAHAMRYRSVQGSRSILEVLQKKGHLVLIPYRGGKLTERGRRHRMRHIQPSIEGRLP